MDFSLDKQSNVKKKGLDNNDNLQLLIDVDIKTEEDSETIDEQEEEDWCISNFEGDALLEPVFFKHVTEARGPQCELCFRYFPDWDTYYRHNLSHLQVTTVNPAIYKCDLCASYFINKQSMQHHVKAHNTSKTKNLSYKPKTYRTEQLLKVKSDRIKYGLRDGMTNSLSYKPKAFNAATDDSKTHLCGICHKTYSYKYWHAHMQDVHGVGSFTCDICDMSFKCERYLKKHLSNIHIGKVSLKTDVKCDLCDTVLQSSYALTTHKRNVHSDSKYVCYICKSTLKCKSYLLAHMRRVHHSDGKKHECECGKSFKSRRYLMVHKRNAHSNGRKVVKTEKLKIQQ